MRWWLSPGIGYRGYGQKRADGPVTLAGHLKPTTAAIEWNEWNKLNDSQFDIKKNWKKNWKQKLKINVNEIKINYLLDCKEEEVDLANCIRECVHHKPNHRHNDVVMVHQKRILNMWSSIRHYLDKFQKHIHIQATRLVMLWLKDNCLHFGSVINSPQLS